MKTRVRIAVAVGLLTVAGCGASGLETGAGTVEDKTASAFLTSTEAVWHKQVDAEPNKSVGPSARCYYVTGSDGKQSLGTMACGPLRRLGTPERQVWDIARVEATGGDRPGLTLPEGEKWQQSQLRPDNSSFWRPDDKKADSDADALAAPAAPPAQPGLTMVVDKSEKLELKPAGSKLIVPDGTLALKALATPDTMGSGSDVKAPATGEKFIAAEFTTAPTIDPLTGSPAFDPTTPKSTGATKWTVTVGTEQRPVDVIRGDTTAASPAQTLYVSVPKDATDVTLTATNGPVVQKLSLITGERTTPDVAAAYYRTGVSADLNKSFPKTIRNVGMYFKSSYSLSLGKAGLSPWDPARGWAPAGKTWMRVQVNSKLDYNYILYKTHWAAPYLTATADGTPVSGIQATQTDTEIVFPVPAGAKVVQLSANNVLTYSATDPGAVPASGSVTFPSLTATATFR